MKKKKKRSQNTRVNTTSALKKSFNFLCKSNTFCQSQLRHTSMPYIIYNLFEQTLKFQLVLSKIFLKKILISRKVILYVINEQLFLQLLIFNIIFFISFQINISHEQYFYFNQLHLSGLKNQLTFIHKRGKVQKLSVWLLEFLHPVLNGHQLSTFISKTIISYK